jgi:hypothetical protein
VHVLATSERLQQRGEQLVRPAVIERDVRRRPQHGHHALALDAELVQYVRVRLEVGQVVLLLEPRVLAQLPRSCSVPAQPCGRDRIRRQHPPRKPAADLVLGGRPLVVEGIDLRHAQRRRREREVVGPMRHSEIEPPASPVGDHRRRAARQRADLARPRRTAVAPDRRMRDPEPFQQRQRLRIVAGGHARVVTRALQMSDHRPEHHGMRRGGHVEPDPHPRAHVALGSPTHPPCRRRTVAEKDAAIAPEHVACTAAVICAVGPRRTRRDPLADSRPRRWPEIGPHWRRESKAVAVERRYRWVPAASREQLEGWPRPVRPRLLSQR